MERKTILVVGAGALGSHLVPLIRNVGNIVVMDFDRIEAKNVLSQFHAAGSIGKNKAQALQQVMKFLFKTDIEAIPHRLTLDNVERMFSKGDIIVDCVDNGHTRRVLQSRAQLSTKQLLHGALAANGAFGQVLWTKDFIVDDEGVAGTPTCEDGEHLPFISVVASYLARAVQEYVKTGRKLGFQIHPTGVIPV